MTEALIQMFRGQGRACASLGSAFYAGLCAEAADALARGDDLAGLLAPWAEADLRRLYDDATPIRFLGALHDLVLSGEAPELAKAYPHPGRPADPAAAWRVARDVLDRERERLARFMGHEPQTNEVRRAACLLGGFLTVAETWGLPLRTFELGASAGLNLNWDGFRYDLGAGGWGDPASPVRIDTDWEGPLPPIGAACEVAERSACDRRPVRLDDPAQRRRLMAYLWPDQFERVARMQSAADLAVARDVAVETADAPAWTAARAAPVEGRATVVYHSVFWQYVPAEGQEALRAAIARHAAAASASAPFAWLRMEPPEDLLALMEVRLTQWPGGEDRLLAHVHPHGATVRWVGG